MNDSASRHVTPFFLDLLERATIDNARRIDELEQAVAGLMGAPATGSQPLAPEIVIDADSVSPFAAGFYAPEFDEADTPYRWTGRGDFFEFRLALDRSVSWTFRMDLRANEHVSLSQLRAFVDYVEVPIEHDSGTGHIFGNIPVRRLSHFVVMTFHVPVHFVPSMVDPNSPDHRSLAAVFYSLRLRSQK